MTTAVSRATEGGTRHPAPPGTRVKRAYLHHLDLIRVVTFGLVIFVHCLTQTNNEFTNLPVNSTSLLFHFTRNTFFALTGFVLMYQNFDNTNFSTLRFWRRRIKLVIFPYLIWSLIYWVVKDMWANGRISEVPSSLGEFGKLLMWGLSGFQMYFLFVMLQVYLIFPLVVWLVRATRNHHGWLLGVSLAVQVAITSVITYWTPPASANGYWWHLYATVIPYQFFILYGSVAAVHHKAITQWLAGKGAKLFALLVITAAIALGSYLYGVWFDDKPVHDNNSAFYPTLIPFAVMAMTCLYAVAAHWNAHWRELSPAFARVIAYASNRSFGVFLSHVLVLFFLLYPKASDGQPAILEALNQPWATGLVYLLTLAGSLLLVEVLRRLPGSLYLTGRPWLPPFKHMPFRRARLTRAHSTRKSASAGTAIETIDERVTR